MVNCVDKNSNDKLFDPEARKRVCEEKSVNTNLL